MSAVEPRAPAWMVATMDQVLAEMRDARAEVPVATAEGRCVSPPIGCGQTLPAGAFRDDASRREYGITGTCQACQDRLFAPDGEA